MNTIKKFLKTVAALFTTKEGRKKLEKALATSYDPIHVALPIVELIAALTPTRADDEIVAMVRKYALPLPIPVAPMTDAEKSGYLRTAATTLVRRSLKDQGIPDSTIDTAVQLAYLTYKVSQEVRP